MATQTTNYNFDKPDVGGDADIWGGFLNVNWDDIDAILFAVSGVADQALADAATAQAAADAAQGTADAAVITADAALPVAGGTMTGQIVLATGGTGDEAISVTEAATLVTDSTDPLGTALSDHLNDLDNPHVVTNAQLGALPLAGGTMTGALTLDRTLAAKWLVRIDVDTVVSGPAIDVNFFGPSRVYLTLDEDTILSFINQQQNQFFELWIVQGATGGLVTSWADVTAWFGGDVPDLSTVTGETDAFLFTTSIDGLKIYGQYLGRLAA